MVLGGWKAKVKRMVRGGFEAEAPPPPRARVLWHGRVWYVVASTVRTFLGELVEAAAPTLGEIPKVLGVPDVLWDTTTGEDEMRFSCLSVGVCISFSPNARGRGLDSTCTQSVAAQHVAPCTNTLFGGKSVFFPIPGVYLHKKQGYSSLVFAKARRRGFYSTRAIEQSSKNKGSQKQTDNLRVPATAAVAFPRIPERSSF